MLENWKKPWSTDESHSDGDLTSLRVHHQIVFEFSIVMQWKKIYCILSRKLFGNYREIYGAARSPRQSIINKKAVWHVKGARDKRVGWPRAGQINISSTQFFSRWNITFRIFFGRLSPSASKFSCENLFAIYFSGAHEVGSEALLGKPHLTCDYWDSRSPHDWCRSSKSEKNSLSVRGAIYLWWSFNFITGPDNLIHCNCTSQCAIKMWRNFHQPDFVFSLHSPNLPEISSGV